MSKVIKIYEQVESPIMEKLRVLDKKRADKALEAYKLKISKQVKQKLA